MRNERKDSHGNVLRTGELQQKDGAYRFVFCEYGKRRYLYSRTLDALREKEAIVQHRIEETTDLASSKTTVRELVEHYLAAKEYNTKSTQCTYRSLLNSIRGDEFLEKKVISVRTVDCKRWVAQLKKKGLSYGAVKSIKAMINPAFQEAAEKDIIAGNPFSFNLKTAFE